MKLGKSFLQIVGVPNHSTQDTWQVIIEMIRKRKTILLLVNLSVLLLPNYLPALYPVGRILQLIIFHQQAGQRSRHYSPIVLYSLWVCWQ